MDTETSDAKQALRAKLRKKLQGVTDAHRNEASRKIRSLLEKQTLWRSSQAILFFAPLPDEPDIWPLISDAIALGKTVALPCFLPETEIYVACRILNASVDVQVGKFGIREPSPRCPEVPLNQLDFVLVPGVAFDLNGRRLGRGKGYYDRLLAQVGGKTCGVAFDEQIVDEVPTGPNDIDLNCILTPSRWIDPKQRAVLK
jgi:5-formyltetrahydrofolate cyclo-ligase